MKSTRPLLLFAILCLGIGPLRAEKMFEDESLGNLKLGQEKDAVSKFLGKPDSKGEEVHWEAIGAWVQDWEFSQQGLTLAMSSEKKGGSKIILNITAESPCKLATSRGITINSTDADLTKAYRDVRNKEASTPGKLFVAGSIYGGTIFNLKDGKVVQIFIGAAAE